MPKNKINIIKIIINEYNNSKASIDDINDPKIIAMCSKFEQNLNEKQIKEFLAIQDLYVNAQAASEVRLVNYVLDFINATKK